MMKRLLISRLKRFGGEESGSIAIEALIILPILAFAIMASYTFFEGYRQSASNIKAAYTIGDLISRETTELNDVYFDNMEDMFTLMIGRPSNMKIRMSLVIYDEATDSHDVPWSAVRGECAPELTNATILNYKPHLPPMSDQNALILVETSNTFVAPFRVGLGNVELKNYVFTRPRFANNIKAPNVTNPCQDEIGTTPTV